MKPSEESLRQYESLRNEALWFELSCTVIKITGDDRHLFLHNFCTNEIKGLAEGGTREAFILNGKGKTLAHVHVLNVGSCLVLISPADVAKPLMEHLDRYIIREDVQLEDASGATHANFVVGDAGDLLQKQFAMPMPEQNHVAFDSETESTVANIDLAGFGFLTLSFDAIEFSFEKGSSETLEMLRLEHRTPWFGKDISDANLPQELLRDDIAISFVKGCYLGQETVARIDAIGKVNRVIVALELSNEVPIGAELIAKDKVQGAVTSVAWSPKADAFIALAVVRRPHEIPGAVLECGDATATVVK